MNFWYYRRIRMASDAEEQLVSLQKAQVQKFHKEECNEKQ